MVYKGQKSGIALDHLGDKEFPILVQTLWKTNHIFLNMLFKKSYYSKKNCKIDTLVLGNKAAETDTSEGIIM